MESLQEQLLKAGVVDQKKAKKLEKEKRKTAKHNKGKAVLDDSKLAAQKALAEKAERDREISRQRNAEKEKKAVQAQITQLIQLNRVPRDQGDIAYNFTDAKKIKKLHVTATLQKQLINGILAIVKLGEEYELVPAAVAEKIKQRDETAVILLNTPSCDVVEEDDPYADYQIPDDLMW